MFFSPVQCPFLLSVLHLGRIFVYKSIEEEVRIEYSAAFIFYFPAKNHSTKSISGTTNNYIILKIFFQYYWVPLILWVLQFMCRKYRKSGSKNIRYIWWAGPLRFSIGFRSGLYGTSLKEKWKQMPLSGKEGLRKAVMLSIVLMRKLLGHWCTQCTTAERCD